MKVNNTVRVYPVLVEKLGDRFSYDLGTDGMPADVAMVDLEIDPEKKRFRFTERAVLAETPGNERAPQLLVGGRVAYLSDDDGRSSLFVRKENGRPRPLAPELEVKDFTVSADGKTIYLSCSQGHLYRCGVRGGEPERILEEWGFQDIVGVSRDGKTLYTSQKGASCFSVFAHQLEPEYSQAIFRDHPDPDYRAEMTPDGRYLFLARGHHLTRLDLSKEECRQVMLPHHPDFHDRAPELRTALDGRYLVFGEKVLDQWPECDAHWEQVEFKVVDFKSKQSFAGGYQDYAEVKAVRGSRQKRSPFLLKFAS